MTDPAELERLLGEYYARSGREGADAFIQEHPEYADTLRKHLGFLDLVSGAFHEDQVPERIGIYRIEAELGSGGMGTVYRATSEKDGPAGPEGTTVALKLMHPHLFRASGFFKRFLREADLGRRINHPNVVRTMDVDAVEQQGSLQHFLIMEYVEGQTLRLMLDELARAPEELARHLGLEICKALSAIHRVGAVHRDLKPENVLITPDHAVKVMDLGVAQLVDEQIRLSKTGAFVGSLQYAAPEQFRSGREVDFRADLHGLGLLLYELCCGENPYFHEDVHVAMQRILTEDPRRLGERNPQVSPFLEELVHSLLQKDPDDRIGSADELLAVLSDGEASTWWKDRAKQLRQATSRPLRRMRVPRETAVYGREAELENLGALFDTVKAGDGRVLLIDGEAGIGKTRLVDEFVSRLQQAGEDIHFLFSSYPPGGAATTAGAFSAAFREQLGGEDLEESLAELVPQTPLLIPALAALLRGDAAPDGVERLTKDSLQTCFVHLTRGLAATRPTIVLIDDLHFAPEEGRALFTSLALAVPEHPIFLIGTTRPGLPKDWTSNLLRIEHATSLSVPRLGAKDLVHLLGDSFKSDRLAEELAGKIAIKSDGNPFFVFEIIRGLREGQFISRRPDGSWHTTQLIEDIQVPSSILDLVNARIADLSEDDRTLLDVAACWGYEFDPVLIGETLGMGRIPVLRMLAQIERAHRLVRSLGRNYVFDHHQVQEALYGTLNEQLQEEYHAALANALEIRHGAAEADPTAIPGALCVDICEHFLKGASGKRARRYLHSALAHLEEGFLNNQAIALADLALGIPELLQREVRLRVLLRKNERLNLLGRRQAQEEVIAEATALANDTDDRACVESVEQARGVHLLNAGHYEQAERHYERRLSIARERGDRIAEACATGNLGLVLRGVGRYEEALRHQEGSAAIARELGDLHQEATALGSLGSVLRALGRHEEALRQHERSLEVAREVGDRVGEAGATVNVGNDLYGLGRYREARELYERGLSHCQQLGHRAFESSATGNLGVVLWILGRHTAARRFCERHLELAREIGDRRAEAGGSVNLGLVLFALGRYEEAQTHWQRSLEVARELGDPEHEALALANLSQLWLALGDVGRARHALEVSLGIVRRIGAREHECSALRGLANVASEEYEDAQALELASQTLQRCREWGLKGSTGDSLVQVGVLCKRRRVADRARETLIEAVQLGRKSSLNGMLVRALAHLACLPGGDVEAAEAALEDAGQGGNTAEVRYYLWKATGKPEHLTEAKRLLDHLVEHAPEEYRESMLKNVRLHREIMEAWLEHGEKAGSEDASG